jgi:hypothetical protein
MILILFISLVLFNENTKPQKQELNIQFLEDGANVPFDFFATKCTLRI